MTGIRLRKQKLEKLVRQGNSKAVERIMDDAKKKKNSVNFYLAASALKIGTDSVPEKDREFFCKGWRLAVYREGLEKEKIDLQYKPFYEAAGGLPLSSFEQHTLEKILLLEKHFPGEFTGNEKRDLRSRDPMKVGAIFYSVYKSAKEALGY